MAQEQRLLRADQVAERLQVTPSWVYEAARDGRIPHVRLGRHLRFDWADVEGWLETLKHDGRTYRSRRLGLPSPRGEGPEQGPRANRDPAELTRKTQLLRQPHIAPLTEFVERLRTQGHGPVPWFDPTEAGTRARILLLLETPGRRADAARGSGFVSPDNDDPSAETTWHLLRKVGISRRDDVVAWNIVPWYLGDEQRIARVRMRDLDAARPSVAELLDLLPTLRVVVLLGRTAQKGWRRAGLRPDLSTIDAPHTSRRSMNRPGAREALIAALTDAKQQATRPVG